MTIRRTRAVHADETEETHAITKIARAAASSGDRLTGIEGSLACEMRLKRDGQWQMGGKTDRQMLE